VIVYAVAVPVLRSAGATEMAANLFCLIYACLSNITPPVAMSSYVAAGIAGSSTTKTSLIAMKLGAVGFILPFFFLKNPVLLLGSSPGSALGETLRAVLTSLLGVLAIARGLSALPFARCGEALSWLLRLMLALGGICFVNPTLATDAAGLVLIGAAAAIARFRRGAQAANA